MLNKSYAGFMALSLSLLAACGPKASTSKLDGHYEDSTASKFSQVAGAQRATAEWEPSRGVIISLPLIQSFGKTDMAAAIAASDIEKLWLVVPSTFTGTLQSSPVLADLRTALGRNISKVELVRQQLGGSLTVWSRDWAPQGALTANGDLRLLDFNYFQGRAADDFTAQSMERLLDFNRVSVPVYNEGGNFMTTTTGHCVMTSRVSDANAVAEQTGDIEMDDALIADYYKAGAGCSDVTILPRMPYEGTGHIDMWAKFLNDDTVIVNELRNEVLDLYTSSAALAKAKVIQTYFEARAKDFKSMGYKVIRVPVPGAIFQNDNEVYRSYTNSTTLSNRVLVPRYVAPGGSDVAAPNGLYFDQSLQAKYEAEVRRVYESLGYEFVWVVSDDLIYRGGAVHCTTMQIPR